MSIIIKPLKNGKTVMKFLSESVEKRSKFNRFLKVNQNDTNLACDKFFRQDELYDRKIDIPCSSYKMYSIDDVSIDEARFSCNSDVVHFNSTNNKYIESRHVPSMIHLHKNNTSFDVGKIYTSNLSYRFFEDLEKRFAQGFSAEEIFNVYYSSIINHCCRSSIIEPAFKMLKKGYPIEYVVRLMEKSKIRRASGVEKYSEGMMEFLEQFPYLKSFIVSCDKSGEEVFDAAGAKLYPRLYDKSNNEVQALQIFKLCRFRCKEGYVKTFEPLVDFALKLLDIGNGKGLSADEFKLLKKVAQPNSFIDGALSFADSALDKGVKPKAILKHLSKSKLDRYDI